MDRFLKYLLILMVPILLAYTSEFIFEKLPVFLALLSFVSVSVLTAIFGFFPVKNISFSKRQAIGYFWVFILSVVGLYFLAFFCGYVSGAAYEYGDRSFPMWTYSFYMTIPLMIGAVTAVFIAKSIFKLENHND